MGAAPRYDVTQDLPSGGGDYNAYDPQWVLVVVPLDKLVSFDRATGASVTTEPKEGVALRGGKIIVIDDDATQLTIERSKASHTKNLAASLRRGRRNWLRLIQNGDWLFAWIVPSQAARDQLLKDIRDGRAANAPGHGLRFVGRVHSIRKQVARGSDGTPNETYALQGVGFGELDTQFYYDFAVATVDVLEQAVGGWLNRVGIDANAFFDGSIAGTLKDNANVVLLRILDLVIGRGASLAVNAGGDEGISAGAGAGLQKGAENAYVVPGAAAALLGVSSGVASYADVLAVLQGVQGYETGEDDLEKFVPRLDAGSSFDSTLTDSGALRYITDTKLQGTFLPFFPDFVNRPLWDVLSRYVNRAINEIYTCLRIGPDGNVHPTFVFRQIPLTTPAFNDTLEGAGAGFRSSEDEGDGTSTADDSERIPNTRFHNVPRWVVPAAIVPRYDIGRSDATRTNFVMTYASASTQAANMPFNQQIAGNPPVRDDLDIQRSGVRPLVQTVECAVDDQHSLEQGKWNRLVADWSMGSHLTLNGTLECLPGLVPPVAEGDNVEFDGVVYQIEGLRDECSIDAAERRWTTTVSLSNGLPIEGTADDDPGADDGLVAYPGIGDSSAKAIDAHDPGHFGVLE